MSSCSFTSLCFFFLFACTCIAPTSSNSSTSESSSTISAEELYSTLSFFTSYYTGGERLYGEYPRDTKYYIFTKKYARFQIQKHCKTNATGVYEVRGYLLIQFPYWYGGGPPQSDHHSDDGYGDAKQTQGTVRFWLEGLWSEKSRHLMMIGTASWKVEGKPIILDAVLDLNYTAKNDPTLYTGYVSGTLKSLVSEQVLGYFDPFSIFSFPTLPNYNYSMLSRAFNGTISSDSDVPENQWPSHERYKYCWVIMGESLLMEVEYAAECREKHQHCYPLGTGDGLTESLPRFLLLTPIQCSAAARKLRYMATFQKTRYDQGFGLNSTVIGEASWDDKKTELSGIACRLIDPLNRSANEVGDCTMRLSLRYTSIFSIRNEAKLVGRFRSTRHAENSGYFRKINFTYADRNDLMTPSDVRYEYTELDRVRRSCIAKKPVKKGNTYPHLQSHNMILDMSVENSGGQQFAYIYAKPLWIGNDLYEKKNMISVIEVAEVSEPHSSTNTYTSQSNISYLISLNSSPELKFGYLFESLNWSTNGRDEVEITAEGVYNSETGYLCMVGCRKLDNTSYSSRDCEILVTIEFAALTGKKSGPSKGTITSRRTRTDPLYFEDMIVYSAYHDFEVARSIWRMDIEIGMVLTSNTLASIFVALQILHVKRNPEVPSFVSLLMLLILLVGSVIPLVLNFEVAYLRRNNGWRSKYDVHGGMAEGYEVAVRLSSLVAFLLQIRLLQLVFSAKQRDGNGRIGERKVGFVSLALYASGVLLALLLNWTSKKHVNQVQTSIGRGWDGIWSYAGLFLDGFLLPQVLLNGFRGSGVKALSHPFYMGISALRLAPHAYNQYRAHNYPVAALRRTYYADPMAGFYSRAWDSMIPFGILTLAMIVFLQQQPHGGRRLTFFLKV